MIIKNLIITGESQIIPLLNTSAKAKWMILKSPSTNSGSILLGGPEISPSPLSGYPLSPGDVLYLPTVSDLFEFYQFKECFCYVPGGDVLNVLYGVEGSNS